MINLKEAYKWGNEVEELLRNRQKKQTIKFGKLTFQVNKDETIDFEEIMRKEAKVC